MPLEKIEYKGYVINIDQDDFGDSPREWDNLGTMLCFHKRYDLGDKLPNYNPSEFDGWTDFEKQLRKDVNIAVILPLYLYDHSGIWMSTNRNYPFNCQWDSGQVGYIYVDKETLRKEYGVKHVSKAIIDKAINVLVGEVERAELTLVEVGC